MRFNIKSCLASAAAAAVLLAPGFAQAQVQAGPGAWSAQQTWAADTVNGGNLTGYFYWPASQPLKAGKRALILVLHGCTQTATADVINDSTDGGFNWKTTADQYGAVILAPNATGNVYSNHCWDYASTNHNRSSGHDFILLDLVNRFKNDPKYAIDPNQVYVTGLSSGGGETMALGCLAPDVFAGIGINAGPALGTPTSAISYVPAGTTAASTANVCKNVAGANASKFSTQIANAVWGTGDYVVTQAYGPMDMEAMRIVYGGTFTKGATFTITDGSGGNGTGTPYTDANGKLRTTEISVAGMAHAWPAGPGGQNISFVDNTRVNYPKYITKFFFDNNLRVSSDPAPAMTSCSKTNTATSATISGAATDNGSIASYKVVLSGPTAVNDAAAGVGASFSKTYTLANGYYTGTVTATDNLGQASSACSIAQFLVGSAPAIPAPTGLAVGTKTVNTIALSWTAVSGATGYNVYRNGAKVTATPVTVASYTDGGLAANTTYSYTVTTIKGGESAPSAAVSGTTLAQPSYTQVVTATVTQHYTAGRLNVTQYNQMGAKYGYNASMTLYQCGSTWTNSSTCGPLN